MNQSSWPKKWLSSGREFGKVRDVMRFMTVSKLSHKGWNIKDNFHDSWLEIFTSHRSSRTAVIKLSLERSFVFKLRLLHFNNHHNRNHHYAYADLAKVFPSENIAFIFIVASADLFKTDLSRECCRLSGLIKPAEFFFFSFSFERIENSLDCERNEKFFVNDFASGCSQQRKAFSHRKWNLFTSFARNGVVCQLLS